MTLVTRFANFPPVSICIILESIPNFNETELSGFFFLGLNSEIDTEGKEAMH